MRNSIKSTLALILAANVSAGSVLASDMIITAREGAGAESSTLQNTSEYTFENLSVGTHNNVNWSGVGSFDTLNVHSADQYGAAGGVGHYAVEGIGGNTSTTLTLDHSSQYFGLWWSAGDSKNVLNFYSGSDLVASFTTANLINLLPNAYKGNPNAAFLGQNSGEKYGFINFIADANTSWDKIVFTNNGNSGFEADNYTTRVAGWNPTVDGALPGTPFLELKDGVYSSINAVPAGFAVAAPGAPAPPMTACLAFAGVLLLQALRRKSVS